MNSGRSTIYGVAKTNPSRALFAAVIQQAADDARSGDAVSLDWLRSNQCLQYFALIAPAEADPRELQKALVETVQYS